MNLPLLVQLLQLNWNVLQFLLLEFWSKVNFETEGRETRLATVAFFRRGKCHMLRREHWVCSCVLERETCECCRSYAET